MLKCDFNKVVLQRYWNPTSVWVFSCKFAAFVVVFDSVELLYHKCHKANFKRVESYIESLNWIKKQEGNNKSEK